MICGVENYPGFDNISGFELSQKFMQHALGYNLEILTEEMEALDPGLEHHTVRLVGGESLTANALILASILQEQLKSEGKIELVWNAVVESIEAENGNFTVVALASTVKEEKMRLDNDGVFLFVGFTPNNRLAPAGVKMNAHRYVVTDEKCETAIPGVFAIGDLRDKYAKQIVLSAADGCKAPLNEAEAEGPPPFRAEVQ